MNFSKREIDGLRRIVEGGPKRMLLVTHTNPDGDAVGAILAWGAFLRQKGHEVSCLVPNRYPSFLDWLNGISSVYVYKESPEEVADVIARAEVIFCMDFNQIQRLEGLGSLIEANAEAKKVLMDHHLDPPAGFDLEISHPESSSTCFLVYSVIEKMEGTGAITTYMAEQLYVGIMTDTGSFSFSFLTPELFRAVAVLVERGIDIPYINRMVYHSYSPERVKLMGYALNKMETFEAGGEQAALITLSTGELRRFKFQPGDSEGFVNYPLSIRGLAISAIFIETSKFIRISLRSRVDVDVSAFARRYFEGGGHKNAAGGKSFDSMAKTVERYRKAVAEFFGDYK